MSEEIDIQKLKEEFPDFFNQFSPSFLEFIFSKKIFSQIAEICSESGVKDEEKVEKIAYRITLVLLNQIPKENLTEVLVNGVKLDYLTANQISIKVNKLIFSQVPKIRLEQIQKEKEKPIIGKILGLTEFLEKKK